MANVLADSLSGPSMKLDGEMCPLEWSDNGRHTFGGLVGLEYVG